MKPFKLSELRRSMVYITEQTLATSKVGEAFEALQCEIANVVAERDVRIAELEAAIDKLAQCKGRYHTEANFKALIAVREKNLHK